MALGLRLKSWDKEEVGIGKTPLAARLARTDGVKGAESRLFQSSFERECIEQTASGG